MVLVTGATGIVGSHIVARLLSEGQRVRVLHRKDSDKRIVINLLPVKTENDFIEWVLGDVTDPVSLEGAMLGVSACYHCAAIVSFEAGSESAMYETNVAGTENIVNAALRHQVAVCFISSTAALGDEVVKDARSEQSKWTSDKNKSPYSLSKRYAELAVYRGIEEGLKAIVLNPGIVIGPGNWGKSSTSLVMTAANGMRFYPKGGNGFVDPRDIADIGCEMMKAPLKYHGQHILVAENATFKSVFQTIASSAGKRQPDQAVSNKIMQIAAIMVRVLEFVRLAPRGLSSRNIHSAMKTQRFSNEKIKGLGFAFRPLNDTITYTVNAYLAR